MVVLSAPIERVTTWPELTAAESAVIDLTLSGLTTSAIARERGISPKTVSAQRSSAYRKLGVHSRWELAALTVGGVRRKG
jgi:DNA-binding CsgD family transcriptional regulator